MNPLPVRSSNPFYFVLMLLGISFAFQETKGQDPLHIKFENISVRDGLSQNTPNCIFQDSHGLLWIGTEDGLNKYNGYEFEIFKPDISDTTSISISKITSIAEDVDRNLWIGTNGGGLNKYDRNANSFRHYYKNGDTATELAGNYVYSLLPVDSKHLWIGTENGLSEMDIETGSVKRPELIPVKSADLDGLAVTALAMDKKGTIWIGTENGLNRLDTLQDAIITYRHDPADPGSLPDNKILSILIDSRDIVWIGTEKGIARKLPGDVLFAGIDQRAASSSYPIRDIIEDNQGNIWIATFGGGLDVYVPNQQNIISCTFDYNNPYSLGHNEVSCLCIDNAGIIWAGTYGLDKYNPKKEKFKLYDYIPNARENISFKSIYSIYQDRDGILWIGSKTDGVHIFDRNNNKYSRLKQETGNLNSLSSNKVRIIRENPQGILWIGTDDGGLNKVYLDDNRKPYRFQHFNYDPLDTNSLTSNLIYSLYFDAEGYLWIGTDNGLNRMNLETGDIKRFVPDSSDPNSLSHTTAYYVYGDLSGVMWVATDYGINEYDPAKDGFKHYTHSEDPNSVIINEILTFYEDREGMLWIGTFSGGLDRFDRETKKFVHYNHIRELSASVIYGIFEDDQSNLWMSTNDGVVQFNPKTNFFKQYTIEDGLQSNEFNGGAYFRGNEGEIFFGGYFGFNSFFPERIMLDSVAPQIILTDLQIKNISVKPGRKSPIKEHISEADEIRINHKQNNFTLYFAALHFANPLRNKYRYKLEGFDKDWIDSGTKRYASYTNLPYRKYRFRVMASNSDGKWNEEGISVVIRVKAPLWGTIVFKIVFVLLLIALVIYGIRYRMRREQQQKALLEERVRENTQELEQVREKLETQKEEIILQKQELKLRERDQEELLWFNQGIGMFSELISRNKENLMLLGEKVIAKLVEYVEAQQGGIFLINDDDESDLHLELVAHHAFNVEKLNQKFLPGEGYVGTCFNERNFIEIDDLPPNYSILRSGLGEEHLRHLLLAPLRVNDVSVGVIEIGSFKKIKGYKVAFIEKLCENLASTVATEKSNAKLKKLIDQTRQQAAELQEREEELRQNLEEMQATQEESARREDELIKYAEEAATREEMLNQKIEELEVKLNSQSDSKN